MPNEDGIHRGAEWQSGSRCIVSAPYAIASVCALLWGCATQPDAEPKVIGCSEFPIVVADPALRQTCYEGSPNPQYRGTHKFLDGESDRYFISISHFKSGYGTYLSKGSPRDNVGNIPGVTNMEWSGYPLEAAGFEAEIFTASPESSPDVTIPCFAFSKYWGNVPGRFELDGAPGYLNSLAGFYCDFDPGSTIPEERIRAVLGTITVAR